MKTAAVVLFLACAHSTQAATITAVQNGTWTTASTWDLNRSPVDGDSVVIPAGKQVTFTNTPYPQNNPIARPTFKVSIFGILDFSSPGNDKMYLDAGSVLQIYAGGKIQTTTSSTEIIAIYNGAGDNTVWTGNPSSVNGPAYATSSTSGFVSGILPITIQSFTVQLSGKSNALLKWTTSMEQNSAHFVIESYQTNSWNVIGVVNASGNSNTPINYSFITDLHHGINQFRLKEVDVDNSYTYSKVAGITFEGDDQPKMIYNAVNHSLTLNNTSDAIISIMDFSGRKMLTYRYNGRAVQLSPLCRGIYVAQISTLGGVHAEKIAVR